MMVCQSECIYYNGNAVLATSTLLKSSFTNTFRVSNSLDPHQARHFVWPDLSSNCLQKLSADDTSRERVKLFFPVKYHF